MRQPSTDRGRLVLVLALATAVTVFTATVPLLRDWFDLRVYHGTVDSWIHHGGAIYDYRVPGTTYGFTYPPFAALAMLPMALLGLPAAIAVCLLLDLIALTVVLRILAAGARR
ncbi:glycosyltransferase 87 family protein, partial [Streptomyces sp. TRM76130]|nr:glycosyltransferase 87 family protein [Streptomyces sp. TRM76130]